MNDDKITLLIDLKVQIGYLKLAMNNSQESFKKTKIAHEVLMDKISEGINELETLYEKIEKSYDN
tara:strand:+ start:11 stop:205 length:195 start_codon:yes stop_codon:yes gene_type:complete